MKVWLPNLDDKSQVFLDISDNFTFKHTEFSINGEKLVINVLEVGALIDCRFQILFDLAIHHLANGNYRDAVVSAHAALERFREFYLLVGLLERGFESPMIDNFWSVVGNQSERQLGSYYLMMLLKKNRVCTDLSNSQIAYRNKVVHQGFFPNEQKTHEYCKAVLRIVADGLEMQADNKETLLKTKQFEYLKRKPKNVTIEYSINPLIDLSSLGLDDLQEAFDTRLAKLRDSHQSEVVWPYKNT